MGRVAESIELPYPPDRVWRVATRIADLPRWMPEIAEAALLDPALAAGSRVRLRLSAAAAGAEVVGTVRELVPPSSLVITGSAGPLGIEVSTRLEASGAAATRVRLEIDVSAPPWLAFISREAARRIAAELPAALERFGALMAAEPD